MRTPACVLAEASARTPFLGSSNPCVWTPPLVQGGGGGAAARGRAGPGGRRRRHGAGPGWGRLGAGAVRRWPRVRLPLYTAGEAWCLLSALARCSLRACSSPAAPRCGPTLPAPSSHFPPDPCACPALPQAKRQLAARAEFGGRRDGGAGSQPASQAAPVRMDSLPTRCADSCGQLMHALAMRVCLTTCSAALPLTYAAVALAAAAASASPAGRPGASGGPSRSSGRCRRLER